MKFSYNSYLRAGLYTPAASLIFAFIVVVICFATFFKKADNRITSFAKGIAIPCIGFLLLLIYDIPTLKYTVYLINEEPNDAIQITGTIETIKGVASSPRYYLQDDDKSIVRASVVNIDGTDYYFMTAEKLKIGDRIEVYTLPRSRIVLSWEYLSHNTFNTEHRGTVLLC